MNDFLIYALQTISIQVVFLLVYQTILKEETFFNYNRIYLIGSIIASLVIPLLQFTIVSNETQIVQLNEIILSNNWEATLKTNALSIFLQASWIKVIYVSGVIISFSLLLFKLEKIVSLLKIAKKENFNGTIIYKLQNSNQAFSFLNYIFIGNKNQDLDVILKHELIHKTKLHSLDLLCIELFKVVFWFNPLLYVFQNKLAEVHEFEADATSVIHDKKKYYETIINQVFQVENIAFTNNFFNQSLIKKRIVMLQKSKSKRMGMLKYATVIPVLLVSVILFSTKAIAQEKPAKNTEMEIQEMPFATIDQIPLFKDCKDVSKEDGFNCFNTQMANHIKENFTYPEEAAKNNIEGRVSIQFTIDKDGKVIDILTRGPQNGALLEAEAKRIIALLPPFTPGKQKGKAVKVKYGLPLMFKLIDEVKTSGDNLVPPPPPPTIKNVPAPPKPTINE
jgi:bla regulator protein blaR1